MNFFATVKVIARTTRMRKVSVDRTLPIESNTIMRELQNHDQSKGPLKVVKISHPFPDCPNVNFQLSSSTVLGVFIFALLIFTVTLCIAVLGKFLFRSVEYDLID